MLFCLIAFFSFGYFLGFFEFLMFGFGVLNLVLLEVCKLLGSFYILRP